MGILRIFDGPKKHSLGCNQQIDRRKNYAAGSHHREQFENMGEAFTGIKFTGERTNQKAAGVATHRRSHQHQHDESDKTHNHITGHRAQARFHFAAG